MPAHIIDGKAFAVNMRQRLAQAIKRLEQNYHTCPNLAVILVGEDPASQVYVRNKIRQTKEIGIGSIHHKLPASTSQDKIIAIIKALNTDPEIDGILLQLPLPDGRDSDAIIAHINADKDVDGLSQISAGKLILGQEGLRPCTPTGCVILAKDILGDLTGKHCVVVGRSILVGKPAALLFLQENCTVTLAHSRTHNLPDLCAQADILVLAVGRPEMVKANWIKPGACVIDVGINRIVIEQNTKNKTKLVGDADFFDCSKRAGYITPVPGGVGPMTIACLLRNTILAACMRRGWHIPDELL